MEGAITIRRSSEGDRRELIGLAELDSRPVPTGDMLLGFVDGELRAAVAVESGKAVADPFYSTAELVELLRVSATPRRRTGGFALPGLRHVAEVA